MPQHKKLIPIALQVLASQWAICDHLIRQNREEIVNDPKRVELFERMPDIVYPLFLNVDEDIYRGVTTFFSALSRKQRVLLSLLLLLLLPPPLFPSSFFFFFFFFFLPPSSSLFSFFLLPPLFFSRLQAIP